MSGQDDRPKNDWAIAAAIVGSLIVILTFCGYGLHLLVG